MKVNPVIRATTSVLLALLLVSPAVAQAQTIDPLPPVPCPWWDCTVDSDVVVEEYRLDVTVAGQIATTHVTQVLRNDGSGLAQGEFLHPIPRDAAVTDLTLWIDGEPVSGELLDGDEARATYEEIVRRTLDPALLEYVDDGLLRLSVFPISPGDTRRVDIEYRQVLTSEAGLTQFRSSLGREHGDITIESVIARIEIDDPAGIKAIHSPSHSIAIDRSNETTATIGFEATGAQTSDFVLYYSTDRGPVSLDVLSYRDGSDGWFVLLASPGLVRDDSITPKDVAIVLDVSGSMEGEKLEQAKRAASFVLDQLNDQDRFGVIAFSTGIQQYRDGLEPASQAGSAERWVNSLSAAGATNIHRSLSTAFSLEETGRPLYVIFLTDGLPTEGLVDTQAILDALADERSEGASLFAFGVGNDVDTILLDSLTQQHHGTTQYVIPGEQIDEAVSALYTKVASPVLTSVELEVDGIDIWDLQPAQLPDLFSGEQLVLVGRYDGWGPAEVQLSGTLQGERVTIEYDDVRFTAQGGESSVPGLWATRKIGELLRDIRVNGPNEETIDQIVRISIRYGIVTPYTSYLVTEPAPFGDDAVDVISERAAATTTTFAASGEASVAAADTAAELESSDLAAPVTSQYAELIASAGGRTFRQVDGRWIDTTFDPDMTTTRIAFGSSDYFALAGRDTATAAALAIAPHVVVVIDGAAFEIVGADDPSDPLPADVATVDAEIGTTTEGDFETASIVLGDDTQDDSSSIVTFALVSALAAAAGIALVAAKR